MANVPWGTRTYVSAVAEITGSIAGITNAAPAVVNLTAHGLAVGDLVFLKHDWAGISDRPYRVSAVADADHFTLFGTDTSDTTEYPTALAAGGSAYEVGVKTEVTKIVGVPRDSGGDAKKVTYQYFDEYDERSITTGFAAAAYEWDMDGDSTQLEMLRDYAEAGTRLALYFDNKRSNWYQVMLGKVNMNNNASFGGTITTYKVTFDSDGKTSRFSK